MAQAFTGKSSTRKFSRLIGLDAGQLPLWALPVLGLTISVVSRTLDYSLGLPGHHGLELMTVFMFARLTSNQRWACVIIAGSAIAGDVALAFDFTQGLKHLPFYLMAAGVIDLLHGACGDRSRRLPYAALIGALAHMTKPAVRLTIAFATDASFGFMRNGEIFPLVTHAAFGGIGAICGALLAGAWLDARRNSLPPSEPS